MNRKNTTTPVADFGKQAVALPLRRYTMANRNFRSTLWTGSHLQMTLMSIPAGGEIGLEQHKDLDQLLKIESGTGMTMMGESAQALTYRKRVGQGDAVIIPASTWHNIKNIGGRALKLYSVYAPPAHPFGTVHPTKADADKEER